MKRLGARVLCILKIEKAFRWRVWQAWRTADAKYKRNANSQPLTMNTMRMNRRLNSRGPKNTIYSLTHSESESHIHARIYFVINNILLLKKRKEFLFAFENVHRARRRTAYTASASLLQIYLNIYFSSLNRKWVHILLHTNRTCINVVHRPQP